MITVGILALGQHIAKKNEPTNIFKSNLNTIRKETTGTLTAKRIELNKDFSQKIAAGDFKAVKKILDENPTFVPSLLTTKFEFQDVTGNSYKCTAPEFAYWMQDPYICDVITDGIGNIQNTSVKDKTKDEINVLITKVQKMGSLQREVGNQSNHLI